jgi:hypothetical protein
MDGITKNWENTTTNLRQKFCYKHKFKDQSSNRHCDIKVYSLPLPTCIPPEGNTLVSILTLDSVIVICLVSYVLANVKQTKTSVFLYGGDRPLHAYYSHVKNFPQSPLV